MIAAYGRQALSRAIMRRVAPRLFDSFTGSNGTALGSHSPETGGIAWNVVTGTWTLDGSGNVVPTVAAPCLAVIEANHAQKAVTAQMIYDANQNGIGIICNYQDSSNFWLGWSVKTGALDIYECNGGSFTSRASGSYTRGTSATMVLTPSGDTITLSCGGTQLSHTPGIGSRPFKTATIVGMRCNDATNVGKFASLSVSSYSP